MQKILPLLFVLILILLTKPISSAPILEGERMHPAEGENGMVVTSHYLATQSALAVLKNGGNAIDAAVTAAFSLAVTQPRSGNIGGGGFMLISSEEKGSVVAIDYREKAPSKATVDMFLDADGNADSNRSRYSHLAAGVPGTVAGLALALEKFGTISLQQALAPAITLAEKGFIITPRFSKGLMEKERILTQWPAAKAIFYKQDGSYYKPGDRFFQQDLAMTLKRISEFGVKGFYEGKTAHLLVQEMKKHGGLITYEDLKNYSPVIREPVHSTYRGYDIYSMSPPSSGGIHIVQILNILEPLPITMWGHNSAKTLHYMAEAMKYAYADRSRYLGDIDFVPVPIAELTSKKYAQKILANIEENKATPSINISPGATVPFESEETTHFSIADKYGNAVANTYTINFSYGSGIIVEGAGFLLNNEMDDFSVKPGVPNAYGLIGGEANAIAPQKRMLSSMSPTIVKKGGKNFLVTGSPGGSRIISTTLQVIMNVIDHGLNIQSSVAAPRMHHQWLPDELRIEEGISPDTKGILEKMGHSVQQKASMGATQSILLTNDKMFGGADPRRSTSFAEGY